MDRKNTWHGCQLPWRPHGSLLADTPRPACARQPQRVRPKQRLRRCRRRVARDAHHPCRAARGPSRRPAPAAGAAAETSCHAGVSLPPSPGDGAGVLGAPRADGRAGGQPATPRRPPWRALRRSAPAGAPQRHPPADTPPLGCARTPRGAAAPSGAPRSAVQLGPVTQAGGAHGGKASGKVVLGKLGALHPDLSGDSVSLPRHCRVYRTACHPSAARTVRTEAASL